MRVKRYTVATRGRKKGQIPSAFWPLLQAKIGPLLEAQWVFEVCLKIDN